MSRPEPSYYEIALTHRQVVVVFVILLGCLVGAFFSGLWVGRGGSEPEAPAVEETAELATEEIPDEEALGELRFFTEGDEVEKRPAEVVPAPPPPAAADPPPPAAAPPPPPPSSTAAPPPPPAQAAPPATAGGPVIQVFSSNDREKAQEILARLVDSEFPAFLSPIDVEGQPMYRVRVGPFRQRSEAEKTAEILKRRFGLETWITQP